VKQSLINSSEPGLSEPGFMGLMGLMGLLGSTVKGGVLILHALLVHKANKPDVITSGLFALS
jgi:hypothetical protein